jgi:iron complex outermembrane receptor protein
MTGRLRTIVALACTAAMSMATDVVAAENAPDTNVGGLDEVVVSAQRRTESAQDVPISITALSGDQLTARGIDSLLEIAQVTPGLQFQAIGATSVPFLRGVGAAVSSSGAEATVALVVDGVYIAAQPASLMSLNNIDSIEVDKGPQGTLFGRNATGGVIQVRTRRPTQESRLDMTVGYGNYQTVDGSLYGTTGITSTLAADISLSYHDQGDGYGTNLFDGSDVYKGYDYVARTKWLWTPTDSTEITFIGDWEKLRSQTGFATRLPRKGELGLDQRGRLGFQYSGGFYDVDLNFPSGNVTQTRGGSVDFLQRFGVANLRSITAYHTQDVVGRVDFDLTPNDGSHQTFKPTEKTFSEELQLLSPDGSKLSWVGGLYFYQDTSGYDPVFINYAQPNGANLHNTTIESEMKTKSYAAFGQTTIPLPFDSRLTLGVRYTNDKRDFRLNQSAAAAPPATVSQVGSETWPKTTFRAGLDHRFSAQALGYVQVSTGFKSGLFNTQTVQSVPGQPASVPLPVQPEKITAYEVGLKSDYLENRLRFNLAAFYYDYKDQQVNAFIGSTRTLLNAASSKIKGIDFELTGKPSDKMTLSWTGSYLHARYDKFPTAPLFVPVPAPGIGNIATPKDASGNDDVNSPAFTTTLAINYAVPLGTNRIDLNANAYYNSGYFFDFANTRKQGGYTWLNASAKWTFGRNAAYSVTLWGDNLLDREVYSSVNQVGLGPAGLFGGDSITIRPPRTYGVRLGASF